MDVTSPDFGFILKPDPKEGGFLVVEIQKPPHDPFIGHLDRQQATQLRDTLTKALELGKDRAFG